MRKINLNPILRTLTGKNKAGKVLYGVIGVGGAAVGADAVGLNDVQTFITLGVAVATFIAGLFIDNPKVKAKVHVFSDALADELMKATDEKSEGGEKITREEYKQIALGVAKKIL